MRETSKAIDAFARLLWSAVAKNFGCHRGLSTDGFGIVIYFASFDKLGGIKTECSFVSVELSSLNRQPSVEPLAACLFNDSGMLAGSNRHELAP